MGKLFDLSGADGITLQAEAWGERSGQGVLFLHGGGQTRHAWGGAAQAVADNGRYAVTLDMRGHGDSGWAEDGNYSLESFAADLAAVCGIFGSPPAVVGASLGGLTALLAIGEEPYIDVGAVVLVDVAPRLEAEGTTRIREFMSQRPEGFETLEEAAEVVAAFTQNRDRAKNPRGLEKNLRRGEDGRYRWHWDPAFLSAAGPSAIRNRERLLVAAGNITAPALVLRGRESDVLSEEGVAELLEVMPHGEYVDVLGAGHMVAGDRNDAFTRAIADFLDRSLPN